MIINFIIKARNIGKEKRRKIIQKSVD